MVFGFRSRDEVNREVKRVCPSVSPLFCDIKMFCAPFACVQGSQNRLHLSQRDTTEKSECKTLIRPDPDEGFITESAGDSALPRSSLVQRFGAKHAAFYTRASGRGAALEDRAVRGAAVYASVYCTGGLFAYAWVYVCKWGRGSLAAERPSWLAFTGARASICSVNASDSLLKGRAPPMGRFSKIADQLLALLYRAIKRITTFLDGPR